MGIWRELNIEKACLSSWKIKVEAGVLPVQVPKDAAIILIEWVKMSVSASAKVIEFKILTPGAQFKCTPYFFKILLFKNFQNHLLAFLLLRYYTTK